MSLLTWNTFKEHVDKVMLEKGIDPDTYIYYIDTQFPSCVEVGVESEVMDCPTVEASDAGLIINS